MKQTELTKAKPKLLSPKDSAPLGPDSPQHQHDNLKEEKLLEGYEKSSQIKMLVV